MNYSIEWERDNDNYKAYVGDFCIGGLVDHGGWFWCESGTREDCDDYIAEEIGEGKQWVEARYKDWLAGVVG